MRRGRVDDRAGRRTVSDTTGATAWTGPRSATSWAIGREVDFEEGLARTVKWYRENEAWWRPLKERRVKLTELSIRGAFVLESPVWGDDRGFFREWFKRRDLDARGDRLSDRAGQPLDVAARRRARTALLVAPEGQAKLVTCAYGELDDVIVDVRVGSPTFGRGRGRAPGRRRGALGAACPRARRTVSA